VCVCLCVCLRVCVIYIYLHAHTHTHHTHTHMIVYIETYIYIYTYIHINVCMYVYANIYTYVTYIYNLGAALLQHREGSDLRFLPQPEQTNIPVRPHRRNNERQDHVERSFQVHMFMYIYMCVCARPRPCMRLTRTLWNAPLKYKSICMYVVNMSSKYEYECRYGCKSTDTDASRNAPKRQQLGVLSLLAFLVQKYRY
jgi:hypothetical protein